MAGKQYSQTSDKFTGTFRRECVEGKRSNFKKKQLLTQRKIQERKINHISQNMLSNYTGEWRERQKRQWCKVFIHHIRC